MILGVRAVATPLAYGNTVVLKASEICPATHARRRGAARGRPARAAWSTWSRNAPSDAAAVVEALIAHPAVAGVNFTGSTRVGRIIAETAGRHLKRVLLELGGKAPLIVLDDADLERGGRRPRASARSANQGQICMSTERIVVDRTVADAFVDEAGRARERAARRRSARARHRDRAADRHRGGVERVGELVDDARRARAPRSLAGGEAHGPCCPPTVLDGVTPEMRVYGEESFGPLVSIVGSTAPTRRSSVANDTEYGLSAAVFSATSRRALELAQRIESGICHINGTDRARRAADAVRRRQGERLGPLRRPAALEEFTELRWITIETEPPLSVLAGPAAHIWRN